MVKWVFDDGGRKAAGYKGRTSDCTCRAIAIATEQPYKRVYDALNAECQFSHANAPDSLRDFLRKRESARTGVSIETIHRYMKKLGWQWVPTMRFGSGCRVHLKASELPQGRIVCRCSRHLVAVIDGVIHDTFDSARGGTRCVYGYWRKPPQRFTRG